MSQSDLARAAVVPVALVTDFETGTLTLRPPDAIQHALERQVLNSSTAQARHEVTKMSDDDKRRADAAAKRAAQLFERQQQSERRITDEEKRHSDMVAKMARLRKQRLARDAAEAEAEKDKTKTKGRSPSK